ncbi:hypothetical protein GQ42DRAFT_14438 [Ramicandelaber brevisporus]|nr:hypothetical protein GQ42DRAFT_14438 [Ramicandelaber brevisporus]
MSAIWKVLRQHLKLRSELAPHEAEAQRKHMRLAVSIVTRFVLIAGGLAVGAYYGQHALIERRLNPTSEHYSDEVRNWIRHGFINEHLARDSKAVRRFLVRAIRYIQPGLVIDPLAEDTDPERRLSPDEFIEATRRGDDDLWIDILAAKRGLRVVDPKVGDLVVRVADSLKRDGLLSRAARLYGFVIVEMQAAMENNTLTEAIMPDAAPAPTELTDVDLAVRHDAAMQVVADATRKLSEVYLSLGWLDDAEASAKDVLVLLQNLRKAEIRATVPDKWDYFATRPNLALQQVLAMSTLGDITVLRGDFTTARSLYEGVISSFKSLDSKRKQTRQVFEDNFGFVDGFTLFFINAVLSERKTDPWACVDATAMNQLAELDFVSKTGDGRNAAISRLNEALEITKKDEGQPQCDSCAASILRNLGMIAAAGGTEADLDKAVKLFKEAASKASAVGDANMVVDLSERVARLETQ